MHFIDARGILSPQNGMNIYRGCTHGCIYCDSRSLCYHTPIPFEDIEVKQNAPQLLEDRLSRKRSKCMIGTGAMCDPYMHCEKDLKLTRKCLEIIDKYGFGLAIQTKSDFILRDLDLLESINKKSKCVVQMTLTTYNDNLSKIIEPAVCTTKERIKALEQIIARGIPVIVWMTPFLPFVNDDFENFDNILQECVRLKVKGILAFEVGVTLREGNREYLYQAFDKHFPGLKEKYQKTYGYAYSLVSPESNRIMKHFHKVCEENGIIHSPDECFAYMHQFPVEKMELNSPQTPVQGEFSFD